MLKSFRLLGLTLAVATLAATVVANAAVIEMLKTTIERLDPAVSQIVPAGAVLQKVATGFSWTEGPIWIHSGYLLFSDTTNNNIHKLTADGSTSIFEQPPGNPAAIVVGDPQSGPNGLTVDSRGRLTAAGNCGRNVWRLESLTTQAPRTILADSYQGKKLNCPNDLIYRSDGSLYFTDPPYGMAKEDKDPAKELRVNGVYRIPKALDQKAGAAPDRARLQLLISDLPRPNGIAFSPDEHYLYVDNSEPKKFWMRYRVKSDGTLADGKVFYDATSDPRPGYPDGIKIDVQGNVYSAGPGGIWIFSPEGKHLGTIVVPEMVGNLNWGGDSKTLYIAASTSIYCITLNIAGIRP